METSVFKPRCYRDLLNYLGRADATVELLELARRQFLAGAVASESVEVFVKTASEAHNVHVNLSSLAGLEKSFHIQNIVMVYQSFERFLRQFRKECRSLFGTEWVNPPENKDRLNSLLYNLPVPYHDAVAKVGEDLIQRWDYYHNIRIWATHEQGEDGEKARISFGKIRPFQEGNKSLFSKLNAPHKPEEIDFEDFIFFTKLVKLIASKLCVLIIPEAPQLARTLKLERFRKWRSNPDRLEQSLFNALTLEFSFDPCTARRLASELCSFV